jgi:predicted DNA binding CopG/RHH family protein
MKSKNYLILFLSFCGLLWLPFRANSQDSNISLQAEEIERRLIFETFEVKKVESFKDLRMQALVAKVYIPKKVTLKFPDGTLIQVKWKTAERGGQTFNNQPRYEIAAYQFQKLFLDPQDYVVPPTVARCLPIQQYRGLELRVKPTFHNTNAVFFVLQYWLANVTHENIFDESRFESDSTYARHFGNMNIFSYLIKHSDSNVGNFLISTDSSNPRVFAVDNGVAFGKAESNRGSEWQRLRVNSLPKQTVDRLRNVNREDIEKTLGVVAQFKDLGGQPAPSKPSQNLNHRIGVRQKDGIIQFGLTSKEIQGVYSRLKKLLSWVDSGRIQTF